MATIEKRGQSWRALVRRRGQVKSRTFDTEQEAKTWAATVEARIIAGGPEPAPTNAPADPAAVTVADLMIRYSRDVSPGKGGHRWEVVRLRKLADDFTMRVADLDGATVAEWRDRRLLVAAPATVNRELNLLSAVLTRAMKEWRAPLTVNPVRSIVRPRGTPARRRRVSDRERAAILAALGWSGTAPPHDIKQWVAWAFCLALETIVRQGEILRLTWQHVHTARKFCYLPTTKNGHPRDVPLSSRAVALFELLERGDEGARVVPVVAGTFGVYFRAAVKAAGLNDLHFHDTRREALTRTSKKLSNVVELARASGHRDLRSLMVYYEPDPTELADKLG